MIFKGQCHCGAISVEVVSDRPPAEQALGACQCSFCRKHNARAFSDPKAEVTLGGVETGELSSKTMEARKVPGLYFIGEVVDVTGWLGGYNFQWAWASAHAAGTAL